MKIEYVTCEEIISEIELDYYIPITIEYKTNDYPTKELYYYRILNNASSFIEFKVNSETKKIVSIILVSINDMVEYSNEYEKYINDVPNEDGNPIICTEIWNDCSVFTEKSNFQIMYNGQELFLLPGEKERIVRKICMPNIDFLLDCDMEIVGCVFVGIPVNGKSEFEECIKRGRNFTVTSIEKVR